MSDDQDDAKPYGAAHVKHVRSTKPGRALLRNETCTCDEYDDAHTVYESP